MNLKHCILAAALLATLAAAWWAPAPSSDDGQIAAQTTTPLSEPRGPSATLQPSNSAAIDVLAIAPRTPSEAPLANLFSPPPPPPPPPRPPRIAKALAVPAVIAPPQAVPPTPSAAPAVSILRAL